MWINLPQIKHFINKDSNETSRIKTSAVFTRSAFNTTNRLDEDIDLKIIIIIVRIFIVKSIDDGNEVILHMCLLHRYLDIHFTHIFMTILRMFRFWINSPAQQWISSLYQAGYTRMFRPV